MIDITNNYESPVFFGLSGNPTNEEISAEIGRLKDQQARIKAEINDAKASKEAIGAGMIRSRQQMGKIDFGNMQYDLDLHVDTYYKLQNIYSEIGREINRLQAIHGSYHNAVGDTPIPFDWIGLQTLRCIPMTGIHSIVPHGLVIGDRIQVTVLTGTWQGSGVYDVQYTKDVDNSSYDGELIVIHQFMLGGGIATATGYWQKVSKDTPITPYNGSITGCCPPGQHHSGYILDGNACFPDCLSNEEQVEGRCVPKCPTGQIRNSSGVCVCPDGQELVQGVCVPVCQTGYTRNSAGVCVINDCGTGRERVNGTCVSMCAPYQERIGGICVAKCGAGQIRNSVGLCVPDDCPADNERLTPTGACVPKCTADQERVNGNCVAKCQTGYTRNSAGDCIKDACGTGTHLDTKTNTCVADATKCGMFKTLVNGTCVTKTVNIGGMDLPVWSLWVGGALVAGLIVFNVINIARHKEG